jgi:purine-binding chemotaxis protein CheW
MNYEKTASGIKQPAISEPAGSHSRLEVGETMPRAPWATSAEEKKKILKARAKELAREGEGKETTEETLEIVEFLLAYEKYGIESSYIREICPLKELTPVPCTPPFVLGIINMRGQILSVIDIKRFFDLPERGLTDLNKVIILRNKEMEFGILADVILGVVRVPRRNLQAPLPTLTGIREGYLKGITGDRLAILDAGRLLSDKKLVVHEEVET